MPKPKTLEILGTTIDALTLEEALVASKAVMKAGPARYIVLPHVEFMTRARQDAKVQTTLNQAYLRLPNGVALSWAAEYLYGAKRPSLVRVVSLGVQIVFRPNQVQNVLPDRFTSSNFSWPLLKSAAENGQSVFLVGSPKRQTIDAVAAYVAGAIPRLRIAGTFTGHLNETKEQELVAKITAGKPDLVLVGMGFPRQELLMQRLVGQLEHGLMLGEGGSFDYQQFGGHIKRAPAWIQRSGLEWLWRLIREPSRIGRQLAIPLFIWLIYLEGRKSSSLPS